MKAELPAGTIVTVHLTAFGALEVSAWGPERIVAMQVPPSIVSDPPQAAALGPNPA